MDTSSLEKPAQPFFPARLFIRVCAHNRRPKKQKRESRVGGNISARKSCGRTATFRWDFSLITIIIIITTKREDIAGEDGRINGTVHLASKHTLRELKATAEAAVFKIAADPERVLLTATTLSVCGKICCFRLRSRCISAVRRPADDCEREGGEEQGRR